MMSTELQKRDVKTTQPSLDEAYWNALLSEGEFAQSVYPDEEVDSDDGGHSEESYHPYQNREVSSEDWAMIQEAADRDEVVELRVVGYNRGGLLVEWKELRGFVPASQLLNFPSNTSGMMRQHALLDRVGMVLKLRVIELDTDKNRLILSERAAQAAPGKRASILHTLQTGDVVFGKVTNLCDFGAFIDLGGLEGLIHISELSWGRVGHPSHMLERGQAVQSYVLGVDPEAGRIALSLKRLRPDPWKTVDERYQIGQVVEGVITNVVDFGAFACIEEGLEGLVHVSELAEGHFLHPRNVVTEGQCVRARILTINGTERRLGLSLRLTV